MGWPSMNQVGLLFKVVILWVMALLLGIPLFMINGVMKERSRYHEQVIADIARSTAAAQTLTGPLLVVHYRERVRELTLDPAGQRRVETERIVRRERVLVPESLRIRAEASVEERYRGIYKAQIVHSLDTLTAEFRVPPRYGLPESADIVEFEPAWVVTEVGDARGLRRVPVVTVEGRPVEARPGSELAGANQGVSAPVGDRSRGGSNFTATVSLDLVGTESLSFTPVGKDTRVEMRSAWPHPSFKGAFLPEARTVTAAGFTASWVLTQFATNAEKLADDCPDSDCKQLKSLSFGVGFVQPVDIYQQSERSVKYGMLFVGLTFAAFFLVEVLRRLSVHYIQYGLVGFALVLFFLLVISLSEHVAFVIAYSIASAACVGLLTYYIGHVLRSAVRGLAFGAMLGLLYAVLYLLLQSEDYALLLGSLLLFTVLALVMVITRRVDWSRLGEPEPRDPR